MISRRSHQALKTPAYAGAPTERLKYAPSMPHWRPMMKTSPQMTSVEESTRMPAWRSASPKNRKPRRPKTWPSTRPQNFAISPKLAIQSRGTASQPITRPFSREGPLPDHRDLGVRGEQRLREDVVEREDAQERDDDRLVHRAADALRAAGRRHALVAADDRDDRAEQGALEHRSPQVGDRCVRQEGREERPERRAVDEGRDDAAEDAEQHGVDVEQAGHEHEGEEPRHDEVLDRVDAEHLERVELLADLARAEVGGDRRARDTGQDDRVDERGELADRGEHEEPAEAVERAEEHEEVRRLQARRGVAERDGRDQQRKPAEPQGEEELADELAAIGIRRAEGGDDRLARQDHHVPDLF